MIKKDAIADKLEEISRKVAMEQRMSLNSIITELRRKEPVSIVPVAEAGDKPDEKYLQYPLKTYWHMGYSEGMRSSTNWTAGLCYEFPNGRVEIWAHDYVYAYKSMADTHDWMLD